jgi:ATP-dependent DNA helicase RecG
VSVFGKNINIILDRETFAGISILKQYEKVMTMYRKYYQYEEIKGALRERVQKIPEEAYREAIANALIHRVWDINAHIRVAMHDNRIEIISPGGLPDGMTKEEYLEGQISILRNPIIGNIFFRLHHIERFGTGIRRINSAYSKSEIKPKFEVFDNSIKVVLPVMQKELSLSNDEKLIYNLFMGNRKLSSSEIVKHTDFGKTKVIKLLKLLVDQGYIKIEGEGRGTKYTPSIV